MTLSATLEHCAFQRPFRITGHVFDGIDLVVAAVRADGLCGRGEAAGVYYHGETAAGMKAQIDALGAGGLDLDRERLLAAMPAGGARNAVDCALWELESRRAAQPVWKLAGLQGVRPLPTTWTLGAEDAGAMARRATQYAQARMLKLKLVGDGADAGRVAAVRAARPDAWIGVDANQGFTRDSFHDLVPTLVAARVQLVEQPFPTDKDHWLDGLASPIPLAADESVQVRADIERLVGRVDMINIKLDKAGGLTEALAMVALARRLGLKTMVGNMIGTSLSTAPGFVLGQLCDLADLDGPLLLSRDRTPSVAYADGSVSCPDDVWGHADTRVSEAEASR
jgi:L-alanine-DL-glutamate epimerase-like enolase superfamily enzyme